MEKKLDGKCVAVLVTDGFEQSEFEKPVKVLRENGAEVKVVSFKTGKVKAWKEKNWGDEFDADMSIDDAVCENFDALVLPGGVMSPDKLRANSEVVSFVGCFLESGKPIAAICHGPWTLIETGKLKGRKMTSYHSIKTDLVNAGVKWVDEQVVADRGLVTSRNPKDLDAFCEKMVEEIREGVHQHHHH